MIGALIALVLSWVLLHFVEKQSLKVLGFRPTIHRLRLVVLGVLLTAVFWSVYYLLEAAAYHSPYHYTSGAFADPRFRQMYLGALWRVFTSALFEELVFRGALLYILIRRIGPVKAVLVSAVAFGMYHWITVGIHSAPQMLLLFFSMAWMGYALAQSFVVTGTILVPLALHFMTNVMGTIVFGHALTIFERNVGARPSKIVVLLLVAMQWFVYPLVVLLWLHFLKQKKNLWATIRNPLGLR